MHSSLPSLVVQLRVPPLKIALKCIQRSCTSACDIESALSHVQPPLHGASLSFANFDVGGPEKL